MAGSKNICTGLKDLSNFNRGLYCEYLVYLNLIKQNLKFIDHRLKTPVGEIDLLFYNTDEDLGIAIEVKSSSTDTFLRWRVGARQKAKLRMNRSYLERHFSQVQLLLAIVSHDASIELIENFLS